jgi:hypothetical protein
MFKFLTTPAAIVVAALIIGGALIIATTLARPRFVLSAVGNSALVRMDAKSGAIDFCRLVSQGAGSGVVTVNCTDEDGLEIALRPGR